MGDRNRTAVQPRPERKSFAGAIRSNDAALRRKVQIARRQLGMDEDSYRAVLLRITGQTSSTACTVLQLDAVLREMTRLGFKPAPARKISPRAQVRMIHAVWNDIAPLIENGTPEGLRAFVRRQTSIDAPEFLDAAQANKVLEGLKSWRARLNRKQKEAADAGE